jgi:hypothetical protein
MSKKFKKPFNLELEVVDYAIDGLSFFHGTGSEALKQIFDKNSPFYGQILSMPTLQKFQINPKFGEKGYSLSKNYIGSDSKVGERKVCGCEDYERAYTFSEQLIKKRNKERAENSSSLKLKEDPNEQYNFPVVIAFKNIRDTSSAEDSNAGIVCKEIQTNLKNIAFIVVPDGKEEDVAEIVGGFTAVVSKSTLDELAKANKIGGYYNDSEKNDKYEDELKKIKQCLQSLNPVKHGVFAGEASRPVREIQAIIAEYQRGLTKLDKLEQKGALLLTACERMMRVSETMGKSHPITLTCQETIRDLYSMMPELQKTAPEETARHMSPLR